MITIEATTPDHAHDMQLVLIDDNNKPTPTLLGLAALELAVDILIGYAAYRFFKAVKK